MAENPILDKGTALEQPSTWSIGLKYGLISTAISIVFFLVLVLTGQNAFDNTWNWIGVGISIIILFIAQKEFKDQGTTYMSYGQGIGIAVYIALISIIIGGLFMYIYVEFIDTTAMDPFYAKQRADMEAKNVPDEQMEIAIKWTKMLFWPMYFVVGMFFSVLTALIVTIFTQKREARSSF